VHSVDNLLIN